MFLWLKTLYRKERAVTWPFNFTQLYGLYLLVKISASYKIRLRFVQKWGNNIQRGIKSFIEQEIALLLYIVFLVAYFKEST